MLSLRYSLPTPALRRYVRSFYLLEVDAGARVRDVLVPELANLRIMVEGRVELQDRAGLRTFEPGAYLAGAASRPAVVTLEGPLTIVGCGLTPRGWAALFRVSAAQFADVSVPLASVAPETAEQIWQSAQAAGRGVGLLRALEHVLGAQLTSDAGPVDSLIAAIDALLADREMASIEDMAMRLQLSVRQLERITARYYGFGPKLLVRKQRFLDALDALRQDHSLSWQDAAGLAYYDQSHFIRDFKRFTNCTPHSFFRQSRPLMGRALARRDLLTGGESAARVAPQPSAPHRRRRAR